jgi:hypothetical protein
MLLISALKLAQRYSLLVIDSNTGSGCRRNEFIKILKIFFVVFTAKQ